MSENKDIVFDFIRKHLELITNRIDQLVNRTEHEALKEEVKNTNERLRALEDKEQKRSIAEAKQQGEEKVKAGFFSIAKDIFLKLLPYAFTFTVGYLVHHWFF